MKTVRLLRPITLAVSVALAPIACGSPDQPADAEPARSVLEVVLEDSAASPADSVAVASGLGGMCLRGDPSSGDAWAIGQVGDSLSVLPLERLTELAPRDSARLAARLARTADALPGDTAVADFRGLPVVVRDAWLLVPENGDTTYIAIASRRLPMESMPLEEQLTLLAAPDTTPGAGRALVAGWFARSAGMEDALETREPVLAFRTPAGRLHMLLMRETPAEPLVESLARVDGHWRRRWIGTLEGCR
jgi:hypothetical protein